MTIENELTPDRPWNTPVEISAKAAPALRKPAERRKRGRNRLRPGGKYAPLVVDILLRLENTPRSAVLRYEVMPGMTDTVLASLRRLLNNITGPGTVTLQVRDNYLFVRRGPRYQKDI